MPGGRRSFVHGKQQPKRETCPKCSKKGLGVWQRITVDFETIPRKVRSCRYCNHKQLMVWNPTAGANGYGAHEMVEG